MDSHLVELLFCVVDSSFYFTAAIWYRKPQSEKNLSTFTVYDSVLGMSCDLCRGYCEGRWERWTVPIAYHQGCDPLLSASCCILEVLLVIIVLPVVIMRWLFRTDLYKKSNYQPIVRLYWVTSAIFQNCLNMGSDIEN